MKSLTLSFAATTLLSLHVAALPSQNGVALVGPGQFVESSSLDVLEKRAPAWTRVTRSSPKPTSTAAPTSTTTSSSAAASSPTFVAGADVRDLALKEHNRFRALHDAPAMTWSQPLADAAYTWGSRCVFQHSKGAVGPYGENLAATAGYKTDIVTGACQPWEAEAPDYTPDNPNYSHFTQMVWKATSQLGCAQVTCPPGSIFDAKYGNATMYVCEYNPPGNVYPADNFHKISNIVWDDKTAAGGGGGDDKDDVHRHRQIGAYKGILHKHDVSDEAKQHARDMLKQFGVDPDQVENQGGGTNKD
ncbi:hypothetical protein JCM3766R1_005773 [Sporobolomyces carnicolor]